MKRDEQIMDKDAFYYLMDLVSDFAKSMMIDMFLENQSLKAGDFIYNGYHLNSHDVYGNLNRWTQDGIVRKHPGEDRISCDYSLVGVELMNRLGGYRLHTC